MLFLGYMLVEGCMLVLGLFLFRDVCWFWGLCLCWDVCAFGCVRWFEAACSLYVLIFLDLLISVI